MDVQAHVLASGILYRAALRALGHAPTVAEKMALHARVEEAAWGLESEMLREIVGRDVDEGVPDTAAWKALVDRLVRG